LEPPSVNLDDYFSQAIYLGVSLLFYFFVSIIDNTVEDNNKLREEKGLWEFIYYLTAISFYSALFKIVILYFCFYILTNSVIAFFLAITFILSINKAASMTVGFNRDFCIKRLDIPWRVLLVIVSPISYIVYRFSSILKIKKEEQEANSIDLLTDSDNIDNNMIAGQERKLLKAIVSLSNISVHQIMKPRVDVVAVDLSMTTSGVLDRAIECGFSRIPVYEENLDNIKGFLYIKDLISVFKEEPNNIDWHDYIREAYFVPGAKKIDDLLEEFRKKRIHLAMVVDEYGGTDGIVTLEDILEEIVGEITDESDAPEVKSK
jgi:CBS domain containing-hemolysin-like protein